MNGGCRDLATAGAAKRRRWTPWLLATLALWGAACDDAPSVTDPDREIVVFSGAVANFGLTEHDLVLQDSGTILVLLEELSATFADGEEVPPALLAIGFGLGRRNAEGECALTFQATLVEGTDLLFGLEAIDYCLRVSDSGLLPADSVAEYTLTVSLP